MGKKEKNSQIKNGDKESNYYYLAILLLYGFIAVLMPKLKTLDAAEPKFLALSILNIFTFGYVYFIEYKNNSTSIFFNIFKSKIGLVYSLFVLFCVFSFFNSYNISESLIQFTKIFTTFTATWIISIIIYRNPKYITHIALAMMFLLIYDSINTIQSYIDIINKGKTSTYSINGGYSNKNILAAAIFIKIPFAMWFFIFHQGWKKKIGLLAIFLSTSALLPLTTRSFYLGLILLFIVYIVIMIIRFFQSKNKTLLKDIGIYTITIIFSIISYTSIQSIYSSKELKENTNLNSQLQGISISNESSGNRLEHWNEALKMIKNKPLGVGLGHWKLEILEYDNLKYSGFTHFIRAHNDFLEITVENGIIGGVLFILIFILAFIGLLKALFKDKDDVTIKLSFLPAIGLLTYSVDAFFNFPQFRPEIQSIFAIYLGIAIAIAINSNYKKNAVSKYYPLLHIVLLVIASYLLTLNFISSKYQRILKNEKTLSKKLITSEELINKMPKFPKVTHYTEIAETVILKKIYFENNFEKALTFKITNHLSPYDSRDEYYLGAAHYKLFNFDSALIYINEAIKLKPNYFGYANLKGGILFDLGRKDEAIDAMDAFLSKYPKNKEAWIFNSKLNKRIKNYTRAVQLLDSALVIFPEDKKLLTARSKFILETNTTVTSTAATDLFNKGKYQEVIDLIDSQQEKEELNNVNILTLLAKSYLKLNQISKTKSTLKKIIDLEPKNYFAHNNLGFIAFHKDKKYPLAIKHFTNCIDSNNPNFFEVYKNLGSSYLIQNQPDKAIEFLEKALKHGSEKGVLGNLHLLWKSKGNEEKAEYYKSLYNKSS